MKRNITMISIKGVSFLLLLSLFACTDKKVNLYDEKNLNNLNVVYLDEKIKIVFENELTGEIILSRNNEEDYKLISQNLMFLSESLNLNDSTILSKKVFYTNLMIRDNELSNSVIYNSYNYQTKDGIFIRKLSFSLTPLYCLKIYYDSDFIIEEVYFQYGQKKIKAEISNRRLIKDEEYDTFLRKVQSDSLMNLRNMNYVEEF